MAKIILIIAGVLIVGVVAFIFWFARHPIVFLTKGPGKTVTASVLPDEPSRSLKVTMALAGTEKPHSVTQISMPRALAQALGLRAPSGFSEQLLPLDEGTKNNPEMVKFVEEFNRDTLRWVGSLPLPPREAVTLMIPAQTPRGGTGKISFQYEWRGKVLGGSISSFTATLTNQ